MKVFKTPFAATGDRIAIPVTEQPSGEVSQPTGWTPDYQLPNTDPNYKPVGRDEMNGILFEITEALGQMQQFGFADWQSITGGWPIGANVRHADGYWQSLANGNTEEPGAGALWKELLFGNLVPASETIRGVIELATAAEAQALTDDTRAITPKKLGDAMNAHVLGMGQTWQNMVSSRSIGTTYTNTTGRAILVSVSGYVTTNTGEDAVLRVNGSPVASFYTGPIFSGGNLQAVVPPGATYQYTVAPTQDNWTLSQWMELR